MHKPLSTVGGGIFDTARISTSIVLLPHDKRARPLAVTVLLLFRLALTTPRSHLGSDCWYHLRGLRLADPPFMIPSDIDLILGSGAYARIIQNGIRIGPENAPIAQNNTLGWLVFGGLHPNYEGGTVAVSSPSQDSLAELLQRFWCLEEVCDQRRLSADEVDCERQFAEGYRRNASGKYVVRLLFKKPDLLPAGGSLAVARRALMKVQAKMRLDQGYAIEYRQFMSDYEALGHMRPVPSGSLPPEAPRVFYLPHHAIWQASDANRKFKLVFNASCHVSRGRSLNECLHTGPALQADLISVICRWRLFRVAAVADIEKMYRQISIDPRDLDLQRMLWLGANGCERYYQLLTVTYGVSCAPYLALRVLRQLAENEATNFPRAAQILLSSSYVDDILYSADDVLKARQLRDELLGLTEAGGFRLRRWASSHPQVLEGLPLDRLLRPDWKDFTEEQPIKTLGVAWDPSKNELRYRLPHSLDPTPPTKREALSVIARFFDPLGWVSPVLVSAKMLLQDMWRNRLSWDDELTSSLNARWQNFLRGLRAITQIRIPRWIGATSSSLLELHGFADASKGAYAEVVYARVVGSSRCPPRILAAKTRVAPVKTQTIPRLELCAASLLADLIYKLKNGLGDPVESLHAWSDSTVTLAWINADPSRWEVFVSNRVARIQRLLPGVSWKHVPSGENPADLAS